MEQKDKEILGISISIEINMFVAAQRFISNLIKIHGKYPPPYPPKMVMEYGIRKPTSF